MLPHTKYEIINTTTKTTKVIKKNKSKLNKKKTKNCYKKSKFFEEIYSVIRLLLPFFCISFASHEVFNHASDSIKKRL